MQKVSRIISLTMAMAFFCAASAIAQTVSVSVEKKPLKAVLKTVEQQTGYVVFAKKDFFEKTTPVSASVSNMRLTDFLNLILKDQPLNYEIKDKTIFLIPKIEPVLKLNPQNNAGNENLQINVQVRSEVSGIITDENYVPAQGVTVLVKGTANGTTTDKNGRYSIMAKNTDVLVFSIIGFKTIEEPIANRTKVNVVMKGNAEAFNEVVVNGYQKMDAKMATASTFKLRAEEVIQPGVTSIDQMLQGKVPGMMVYNSSGSVNAKPTIRMRGTSTFVGNASPLWVIDNVIRPDPVDISATQLNTALSDAQSGNFSLIGSGISGVNQFDIESITFLRDAAATAIYGVRAANGVIVVTTKKGKAGPLNVSYNSNYSFRQRPTYTGLNLMNSKERVALSREMQEDGTIFLSNYNGFEEMYSYEGLTQALYARRITDEQYRSAIAQLETNNTDWFKPLFRNAFSTTQSISLSGGVGKSTYYGSVSFSDNHGSPQLDGKKLYTASLAVHTEASKRFMLDYGMTASYGQSEGYFGLTNPLKHALQTNRAIVADAVYPIRPSGLNNVFPIPPPLTFNILNEIDQAENSAATRSMMANISLSYKISKSFSFNNTSSVIMDASEQKSASYEKSYYIASFRGWNHTYNPTAAQIETSTLPYGGLATLSNQNQVAFNTRNRLTFSKELFNKRDQIIVDLGNEIASTKISGVSSTEPGYFPERGEQFFTTDRARRTYSRHAITNTLENRMSFYASAVYNFDNRYVMTGTIRTDGSNRFGQYSNARFLPNFGLSGRWNVSNEKWLMNSRAISGLAFRASFGTQGNVVQAVGPELIASYSANSAVDPVTGVPYLGIKSLPYPELRWEKTYQWNFAAEVALFDKRVNLNIDYYLKKSVDLVSSHPIPAEYGIPLMYVNSGTARNSGLEVIVDVAVIRTKNVGVSVRFLNSWNINEISETDTRNDYAAYLEGKALVPGKPRSALYSFSFNGLNPVNGLPLFNLLEPKEGNFDPQNYLVYSGQIYPPLNGTFSPSIRFKSFSLNANFYYAFGSVKRLNPIYDQTNSGVGVPGPFYNANRELINRWRKPGDEMHTNLPALVGSTLPSDLVKLPVYNSRTQNTFVTYGIYKAYEMSDVRVGNSSFLRCNMMQVNYNAPAAIARKLSAKSFRVGLFVNNLFIITSKDMGGQDPEIEGIGTTALPMTRQYGLQFGFDF